MSAIFEPNIEGTFYSLPEDIYRQAPGANISSLKAMRRSPAHYLAKVMAPASEPTPALIFGTLLHRACLEPQNLDGSYVVKPADMDFRTKVGKEWRDAQTVPIIDAQQAEALQKASAKVLAHPHASAILARADKEVSVFKKRSLTSDLLLKGRMDAVAVDEQGLTTIADIKTCEDASSDAFARSIATYGYAEQAAFYMDLIGASYFLFIAVEKYAPYEVAIYCLDEESIALGRERNNRHLDLLERCLAANEFVGYSPEIETISLPRWAKA
jgi:exodeoxyribonuclease VIII